MRMIGKDANLMDPVAFVILALGIPQVQQNVLAGIFLVPFLAIKAFSHWLLCGRLAIERKAVGNVGWWVLTRMGLGATVFCLGATLATDEQGPDGGVG